MILLLKPTKEYLNAISDMISHTSYFNESDIEFNDDRYEILEIFNDIESVTGESLLSLIGDKPNNMLLTGWIFTDKMYKLVDSDYTGEDKDHAKIMTHIRSQLRDLKIKDILG